jgi:hypothetical protein
VTSAAPPGPSQPTDTRTAGPARARWRPRRPHVRRVSGNRLLWTIVGLVLLLGGLAVAAVSLGWFGRDPNTVLMPAWLEQRWRSWDGWAFGVAIAVALIVALLGFLLLRTELRRRGGATLSDPLLPPPTEGPPGRTRISTSALGQALSQDLQTHPAVRRAGVHLTGKARRPELTMRLTVTPEADIGAVRGHVDAALSRFEVTSGWRPDVAEVTVTMPGRAPQRVR